MKGSIRVFAGLLVAYGSIGGIENGGSIAAGLIAAILGLALMASGIRAMNRI